MEKDDAGLTRAALTMVESIEQLRVRELEAFTECEQATAAYAKARSEHACLEALLVAAARHARAAEQLRRAVAVLYYECNIEAPFEPLTAVRPEPLRVDFAKPGTERTVERCAIAPGTELVAAHATHDRDYRCTRCDKSVAYVHAVGPNAEKRVFEMHDRWVWHRCEPWTAPRPLSSDTRAAGHAGTGTSARSSKRSDPNTCERCGYEHPSIPMGSDDLSHECTQWWIYVLDEQRGKRVKCEGPFFRHGHAMRWANAWRLSNAGRMFGVEPDDGSGWQLYALEALTTPDSAADMPERPAMAVATGEAT